MKRKKSCYKAPRERKNILHEKGYSMSVREVFDRTAHEYDRLRLTLMDVSSAMLTLRTLWP